MTYKDVSGCKVHDNLIDVCFNNVGAKNKAKNLVFLFNCFPPGLLAPEELCVPKGQLLK